MASASSGDGAAAAGAADVTAEAMAAAGEPEKILIPYSAKFHNEWKISYRKEEPEKLCMTKFVARLKKQADAMAPVAHLIPERPRHKPLQQILGAQVEQYKRKLNTEDMHRRALGCKKLKK